jgi:hypothetical protein
VPIFCLEPQNGDTSHPSWQASDLKEGCWVEAESEAVARLRVERATLKVLPINSETKVIFPPWRQERLVACQEESPPQEIPQGKILTKSGKLLDTPLYP